MHCTWGRPVEIVPQLCCVVAAITILTICAVTATPLGTDGELAIMLCLAAGQLAMMVAARVWIGRTPTIALGLDFLFFGLISLLAGIASAAVAVGHAPYVDGWLEVTDHRLAPWYDWPAVARGLSDYPRLASLLGHVYVSLDWQPFLLFGACGIGLIRIDRLDRIVAAWGVALATTIAPFHWLPAKGAYIHYGIQRADLPGMRLDLPWRYPVSLAELRAAHPLIDLESINGIITVPSFHACAAILFAWAFAHSRLLRWPMIVLNAGMVTSAVTMGGHYLTDIATGTIVALSAIAVVCALDGERMRWPLFRPAQTGPAMSPIPIEQQA